MRGVTTGQRMNGREPSTVTNDEDRYTRADQAFFTGEAVPDAIVDLASASRLTIYCGAGVTIDRTELGWGDLIYGLLLSLKDNDAANKITEAEALALRDKLTPLELASIYEEYSARAQRNSHGSTKKTDRDIPHLQEMLYESAGWESGVLVRNVVRLAAGLTLLGITVKIVTSNYDTYIEDEFADYRKQMQVNRLSEIPGVHIRCAGRGPHRSLKATGPVGSVEIVYLHGQIGPTGGLKGQLALSERDYHRVRAVVVDELVRNFSGSHVLIVGSGLSDPPLLQALYETTPVTVDRGRYALVPATSTGMMSYGKTAYPRLVLHQSQRMQRYETTALVPDFHFQVAQFCQEILTCVQMGRQFRGYGSSDPKAPERYGERLVKWWDDWSSSALANDHALLSQTLRDSLQDVAGLRGWGKAHGEIYKLELWARHDPAKTRGLALWAGSTGILTQRESIKTEELDLETKNASVRAFIEGKPVWLAREDLGKPDLRPRKREWIGRLEGRWERYLAVPIRLDNEADSQIPVGVVTLAAMGHPKSGSGGTNIPTGHVEAMDLIISRLERTGRDLLRPVVAVI
jgi:hypothetical protein